MPRWYAALPGSMTRNWAAERFAGLPAFCACLLAPWIGLGRRYFGYYLVTA